MSTAPEMEQRIREAAFRALVKHGYADLSLTDIGEELGQNPSIIYHYFDNKDDLLLSMIDVFVDIFIDKQEKQPTTDAEEELRTIIDRILHPNPDHVRKVMSSPPENIETAVSRVFVELWAHAIWDGNFRTEITQVENSLREMLTRTLRAGIERGEFQSVDPELTADHILYLLKQGLHTHATTNRAAIDRVHTLVIQIVDELSIENSEED